jgi:Family of unknown function (DUF6951)
MVEDPGRTIVTEETRADKEPRLICVRVQPGVCGFPCTIRAKKTDRRTVAVTISGSQCRQIQKLSGCVTVLSMKELFIPLTRNPVYTSAEQSGCHASCAVPSAILKAAEVAMEMAVPRDVQFQITCPLGGSD